MKKRGFTLIELLVVISIISLLSSVVLASLNVARNKARTAAAQSLEANIQHALGASAFTVLDFTEGSGTAVHDTEGGNDMTLTSASLWTPGASDHDYALTFNGSDSGATPSVTMPSGTVGLTVGLWVKTNTPGIVTGQGTRYRLFTNQWLVPGSGVIPLNMDIADGKWHYVALSLKKFDARAYVDGVQVGKVTLTAVTGSPAGAWQMGTGLCADVSCTGTFTGSIDNFRIYSESIF